MSGKFQPGDKVTYHFFNGYASLPPIYNGCIGEIVRRRKNVYIVRFNNAREWYVMEDELELLSKPIEWTSRMTSALQTLYGDI